jgi:uncharacterized membrane protein YqjE
MAESRQGASGAFASARALGPALLALLRTRLELFGIELSEEKGRIVALALLGGAVALLTALALLLLNVLVVIAFWEQRIGVVAGLTVLYSVLALFLGLRLKASLASQPMLFAATVGELQADLAALRGTPNMSDARNAEGAR